MCVLGGRECIGLVVLSHSRNKHLRSLGHLTWSIRCRMSGIELADAELEVSSCTTRMQDSLDDRPDFICSPLPIPPL